jgi:hypothetical protein
MVLDSNGVFAPIEAKTTGVDYILAMIGGLEYVVPNSVS